MNLQSRLKIDIKWTPRFNPGAQNAEVKPRYQNPSFVIPLLLVVSCLLFIFPSSVSAIQKPPNNLGLVGYWSFNEGTGSVATDFSGRGNNVTLINSPTWISGKLGGGLRFNGTNNYGVVNPISGMPNINGQMTISLWVKYPSVASRRIAFTLAQNDSTSPNAVDIELTSADPTRIGAVQSGATTIVSAPAPAVNVWHHIAYVQTGSGVILYINGAQANTASNPVQTGPVGVMRIGSFNSTYPTPYWNGDLDEIRVYNRPLTATEISALYKTSSAKFTTPSSTGLVGHWSMDDATSTIATDMSGNNITGTLTNMNSAVAWVNGKRGKALDFDGSDDYLNLGNASAIGNLRRSFTVSSWFKASSATPTGRIISAARTNSSNGFGLGFFTGPIIRFTTYLVKDYDQPVVVVPGKWHHLVTVMDSSDDVTFYLDGQNLGTVTHTVQGNANTDDVTFIGATTISGSSTISELFDGVLDDIRVYDRVLTAAEIAGLYRSGQVATNASQNNKITGGLVGLWSMNGQDITWGSSFMRDGSGNGNNGTLGSFSRTTSIDFGVNGQALKFDGSANQITSATQFVNPQTFSVSIWFKTTIASGRKLIGFETAQTGTASASFDRHLYMGTDGKIYFGWYPGGVATVASLSTLNDGEWHHAVGTHNGSSGILYIDGVYQGTNTGSPQSYSGYWRIGGYKLTTWTNAGDGYFSGSLDEARVYNRTITQQEVKQLYNMGRQQ